MDNLKIDADLFIKALRALQPDSSEFVFQTFTDDKSKTKELRQKKLRDPLATAFVATPEAALPRLEKLMQRGAGCFVQVNYGTGRGKDNIVGLATFFLDTDGAPLEPIIKAMPKPLMVVGSSNGNYHVYWRTDAPMEQFKATQKELAAIFGCDESMVNLDRVCRVPGTYHLKDPSNPVKVTAAFGEDVNYDAEKLLTAARATRATSAPNSNMAEAMVVTGEQFELPETLPEGNRTQHLVAYAGQLVGQGYGEATVREQVKKAMLERLPAGQSPISDEMLELEIYPAIAKFVGKAGGVVGQTDSQVPSPPTEAPAGWGGFEQEPVEVDLSDLNADAMTMVNIEPFLEQMYFVERGSRVVHISPEGTVREYKIEEFKNSFGNLKYDGKALPKMWLENRARKTVYDVQYYPNSALTYVNERKQKMINNYVGPELMEVEKPHPAQMQTFFDHMKFLFPSREDAKTFMFWMAITVRKPEYRVPWAPFIISKSGIGKGWIYQLLRVLCGTHNCATIGPDDLSSGYNEFMFEKTVLLIDEIKTSGRDQFDMVNKLKPLITEPTISVNVKYGAKGTYPTFVNVLCFTNHINALPVDDDDRRFWVVKCTESRAPQEYYDKLWAWLETDGPAHLYKWLQDLDLSGWNPNKVPEMTVAKQEMIDSFRSDVDTALLEAIEDRTGPFGADVVPLDVIEQYVADTLELDAVNSKIRHQVKLFVNTHCAKPDGDDRPWTNFGSKRKRRSAKIVRNADKWVGADQQDIVNEMERAWKVSLGSSLAGNLTAVK